MTCSDILKSSYNFKRHTCIPTCIHVCQTKIAWGSKKGAAKQSRINALTEYDWQEIRTDIKLWPSRLEFYHNPYNY